jgi:hypothetical protein
MKMIEEERWLMEQLKVVLGKIWRQNGFEQAKLLVKGWVVCTAL